MALAETARLIASLELQDKLSPGVNKALGGVKTLETRVGGLQGKLGHLSTNIRGGVSNSLNTFTGRLKGAAGATLGLLGVGGLFTLGAAFKAGIDNAREFGDEVFRLQGITGLTATETSRLADALGDFGVESDTALRIAGLFEKNVSALTSTKKKAAAFEKEYGLNLRDSAGHTLDFNKQLLNSADFFNNKAIPASQKAAGLAKLYGRNWQALIPILSQGRDKLQETLDSSLTLSQEDIKAIEANRVATRKWNDAIGDLQVKIGIGLMPTLTELVTTLTGWIDTHGGEIQQFSKNAITTIRGVAGSVVAVVSGIKSAWDALPDPVKDILIKGVVAERTVKFLFGFSVTDVAKGLVGGVAGGLGNALVRAGVGKAFVQPVFVTNPSFGGGGVPAGGAVGGGISTLGKVFLVGEAIGLVLAVNEVRDKITGGLNQQSSDIKGAIDQQVKGSDIAALQQSLAGVDQGIEKLSHDPIGNALLGDQLGQLKDMRAALVARLDQLVTLNTSGSPDDRDERHRDAVAIAKTLDTRTERLRTKIEDTGAISKAGLDKTKTALDTIRSKIAVDDSATLGATRSGSSQIVSAIERNKPVVNVTVYVSPSGETSVNYETGGTLGRTGGGARRR